MPAHSEVRQQDEDFAGEWFGQVVARNQGGVHASDQVGVIEGLVQLGFAHRVPLGLPRVAWDALERVLPLAGRIVNQVDHAESPAKTTTRN